MAGDGLTPALVMTCARLSTAMASARNRWWIIGSAAVALHGADAGEVRDVDVLLSRRDAAALCTAEGIAIRPASPHPLFRSALFARWTATPLTVELMAAFDVATADGWRREAPVSRVCIETTAGPIYVPDCAELVAILRRFGRPKDIVRAAALAAL